MEDSWKHVVISILEKEMSSLKKQHLDNVFDTWNYLSEIKVGFFYDFELGTHADSDFESLLFKQRQ